MLRSLSRTKETIVIGHSPSAGTQSSGWARVPLQVARNVAQDVALAWKTVWNVMKSADPVGLSYPRRGGLYSDLARGLCHKDRAPQILEVRENAM